MAIRAIDPAMIAKATTYTGMLKHLATLLWSYPRWRVLLGFYTAVFVSATGSAVLRGGGKKPKGGEKTTKKKPEKKKKTLGKTFTGQFKTLIKIAIPGWTSRTALRLYFCTMPKAPPFACGF